MLSFSQQSYSSQEKGFVILFAILISSVILLISAGILSISQKEVVLSSYSRESQKALFAADGGLECALFYDVNPPVNNDGEKKTLFPVDGTGTDTTIDCSGASVDVYYLDGESSDDYDHLYVLSHQNTLSSETGCSFILIEKTALDTENDPPDPSLGVSTRITSVGFNQCESGGTPEYNDPSILERRLSASYTVY